MHAHKDPFADGPLLLDRRDLVEYEHALKDALRRFLPFTSYSLFFPRQGEEAGVFEPEYRAADGELLLPLVLRGRLLAWFMARGVKLAAPKSSLRYLQALASSVLERLRLYKQGITDPLTGLANRQRFQQNLILEIGRIKSCLMPASGQRLDADLPSFSGCLGLVLMDLDCFQRINENYGYATGDRMVAEVGAVLARVCPKHVVAARLQDDAFALLLPDATPRVCFQLAEVIREEVGKLSVTDDLSGDRLQVSASLGAINYPQGLSGAQLKRSDAEQARILLRKARKAVATAKDHGRDRVFAYADVLKAGGRVLEILPMNRLSTSLGRSVDAQEGQRFLVWSPKYQKTVEARLSEDDRLLGRYPTLYKGEVVLTVVQDEMSFAEVLHTSDPSWTVEAGDRLTLIQDSESFFENETAAEGTTAQRDMLTGLYSYRDFLTFFARARLKPEHFCLALARIQDQPGDRSPNFQKHMDGLVRQTAELAAEILGGSPAGGRFGLGGLAYFLPDRDPAEVLAAMRALCAQAAERLSLNLAVGTACHPYLNFSRADILDNARKALDHALLLPPPRAALFDSVSLNIAADKLYMDGDIFGAVDEFKRALLADENNVTARNSLGICLAQLGRFDQARSHFEQVIARDKGDIMAHYNLGWACQRLGDSRKAREAYRRCLKLDPRHVFSLVRLGTLAERENKLAQAEKLYAQAADLPGGQELVLRHLARVCLARGERDRAREYLHLALNANHNDAQAMHLLARLYLESGEDPQIAEVLARQSAALTPDHEEYWRTLAQALLAQGKDEEAARVETRLG